MNEETNQTSVEMNKIQIYIRPGVAWTLYFPAFLTKDEVDLIKRLIDLWLSTRFQQEPAETKPLTDQA